MTDSSFCTILVNAGGLVGDPRQRPEDAFLGMCAQCGGQCWFTVWIAHECGCRCCWECKERTGFNARVHNTSRCRKGKEKEEVVRLAPLEIEVPAPESPRSRLLRMKQWGSGLFDRKKGGGVDVKAKPKPKPTIRKIQSLGSGLVVVRSAST